VSLGEREERARERERVTERGKMKKGGVVAWGRKRKGKEGDRKVTEGEGKERGQFTRRKERCLRQRRRKMRVGRGLSGKKEDYRGERK
jgi:hypothetical protein